MKTRKRLGFTIVELVIVIAVIAILAAILIPTFSGVIQKANESSDTQLIRNLNTAIAPEKAMQKNGLPTAYDAFMVAKENGYDVSTIVAKSGYNIAYDVVKQRFVLLDAKSETHKYLFPLDEANNETGEISVAEYVNYFVVCKTPDDARGHSIYAGPEWETASLTVEVGFDAGECTAITELAYVRAADAAAQDVVIRTNSDATTLKVTDTTDSKIMQYGDCGILEAEVGMNSLYIEGHVNFVEAKAGHIVANGLVDAMFTSAASLDAVKVEGNVTHAHASTEAGATALNGNTATNAVTWDYDGDNETTNNHPDVEEGTTTAEVLKEEVASVAVSAEFASKEENAEYVARVGQVGYTNLVTAWQQGIGKTVCVLKNIDLSATETVALGDINKSITLDLQNHTINLVKSSLSIFYVQGATFIIKDGTLNAQGAGNGGIINAADNSVVECYNVKLSTSNSSGFAIATNGNVGVSATIRMYNCEMENKTGTAVFIPAAKECLFEDCKVVGTTCTWICGGNVTIDGGEYLATKRQSNADSLADSLYYLGLPAYASGCVGFTDSICIVNHRSGYTLSNATVKNATCGFTYSGSPMAYGIRVIDMTGAGNENISISNIQYTNDNGTYGGYGEISK